MQIVIEEMQRKAEMRTATIPPPPTGSIDDDVPNSFFQCDVIKNPESKYERESPGWCCA